MTNISSYRHKIASMKLLNDNDIGVQVNTKEDQLWSISEVIHKTSGRGETSHTNVIWVQNPWTQLTNTERGTDMPAATISSSQHPNNEECGIRDVWAHNLEDEFRTIRQVNISNGLQHSVFTFSIADCPKISLCCNGHRVSRSCSKTNWRIQKYCRLSISTPQM